jgi:hypothetical protein
MWRDALETGPSDASGLSSSAEPGGRAVSPTRPCKKVSLDGVWKSERAAPRTSVLFIPLSLPASLPLTCMAEAITSGSSTNVPAVPMAPAGRRTPFVLGRASWSPNALEDPELLVRRGGLPVGPLGDPPRSPVGGREFDPVPLVTQLLPLASFSGELRG